MRATALRDKIISERARARAQFPHYRRDCLKAIKANNTRSQHQHQQQQQLVVPPVPKNVHGTGRTSAHQPLKRFHGEVENISSLTCTGTAEHSAALSVINSSSNRTAITIASHLRVCIESPESDDSAVFYTEMASLDSETPIDSLPEEVLCMIFDRLNLRNVKTASLTCRKWHDIIFSSAYVNRFKLEIRFEWSTIAEKCAEWSPRQMKKMIDTLKHTQRFHRNMSLRISHTLTDNDFQAFWECLHPRVTEHINSLQLDIMSCSSQSAILAILNGITLMPKLRSLSFDNCSSPYYNLPILRNATVNHLKMHDLCVFPFDMPELQSFEGPASALAQPNQPLVYNNLKHITITELLMFYRTIPTRWAHVHMPEIQSFQGPLYALTQLDTIAQPKVFAKLKRVTLTDCLMRFENQSSLHRLARVETLHLSIDAINDWFLPAVCEACPALKHLYFDCPWLDIYPATLRQLSKFVNLRHLVISSIETSYTLAVGFDYGLSQLTQLELLDLGSYVFAGPKLKTPS
ncbi:hypothetical protein AND_005720 [Anopheles darlingi]|uniref:F-box domain-containing protein n=1 Tax=Anopheles darlingi TaxID=43151 RepID=W5JIG2_ANODA|nr:hypothetical protein AND_005720 [Anopheles darlingi]